MSDDTFLFSFSAADDSERDLKLRVEALQMRIDNIVDNIKFDDTPYGPNIPVLSYLLRMNPKAEELERLGKALERLAPLRKEHEKYAKQLEMIQMIKADRTTIAALFGEFGAEGLDPDMFHS